MSKGPRNAYNIAKIATQSAKLAKEIKDIDAIDVGLVAAGMVLGPLTGELPHCLVWVWSACAGNSERPKI